MSTPRITAEGIKIICVNGSCNYQCGRCGEYILWNSYGVPAAGVPCPHCGTHNRADFSMDLPSETMSDLAVQLERDGRRLDSNIMLAAAEIIRREIPSMRHYEETSRIVFGGDAPTEHPPTIPPELTRC